MYYVSGYNHGKMMVEITIGIIIEIWDMAMHLTKQYVLCDGYI